MAADTPTRIPDQLRAGDTLKWSFGHNDYLPGDSWVLTTEFVNSAGTVDEQVAAITDPDDATRFLSTVAVATTAAWAAGDVYWISYVTKSGERFTLCDGTLEVSSDLAVVASHDARSHVKKTLDAIEATIEGTASKTQASYSIEGRSLSRWSFDELVMLRDKYRAKYKRELNAARAKKGLPRRDRAHIRFDR